MKVVTAPFDYEPSFDDVLCFLAGGITDCYDWQQEVITLLQNADKNGCKLDHLVVLNPRRENFPINDSNAVEEQILWEYRMLERCDIFSMYFASSESVQPICMYELGRNIVRMIEKCPLSWKDRIVISVEDGYKRRSDVLIQSKLATMHDIARIHATPQGHVHDILMCYTWVTEDL